MDYIDFDMEISRSGTNVDGEEEYQVAVRSHAGAARATMRFSFDKAILKKVRDAVLLSAIPRRGALTQEEQIVQEFGGALFQAFMTDEVRSLYDVSQTEARLQETGLRLKLHILAPELAVLPWEFLYDPRVRDYLCLSRNTPIIRHPEVPRQIQPLKVEPPLRILGVIASPDDMVKLNVEREKQHVDEILKDLEERGLVKMTWLEVPTWRELQRVIRRDTWHIFHFIGHGEFEAQTQEGAIVLCNDQNRSYRLTATNLGVLLKERTIQLALLNACEGARGSEDDLFSSTAATLIQKGIPAVLAMQVAITDDAAIEFTRTFYETLAEGIPIDAAVIEARIAIMLSKPGTLEWGTPVLYMRSPDGHLFDIPKIPKPPIAPGEQLTPTPPVEKPEDTKEQPGEIVKTRDQGEKIETPRQPQGPQEMRQVLSTLAQRQCKVLDALDLADWKARVQRLEQSLLTDTFKVLVMGRFGTGKSTFINALLGKKVLPTRMIPTTSILTEIKWGESPKALLHFPQTTSGAQRQPVEVPIDQIGQYIEVKSSRSGSPNQAGMHEPPYEKLELFWPLEFCRDGLELIDTPGAGDDPEREKIALHYLPFADTTLFVMACDAQLSMSEQQLIETINKAGHEHTFFLCNRINLIEEEEQSIVKQQCLKQLAPYTKGSAQYVSFINARGAVDSHVTGNTEQLDQSGLPAFEETLKTFFSRNRTLIKVVRSALELKESISAARDILSTRREAQRSDMKQAPSIDVQRELDPVERERQQIEKWLTAFSGETNRKVRKAAIGLYDDITTKIKDWVHAYEIQRPIEIMEAFARAGLQKVADEVVKFLNGEVERACKEWQASTLEPLLTQRVDILAQEYARRRNQLIANHPEADFAGVPDITIAISDESFIGLSIGNLTNVELAGWKTLDFVADLIFRGGGEIPSSKAALNQRIKNVVGQKCAQKLQSSRNELADAVVKDADKVNNKKLGEIQGNLKRLLDLLPRPTREQLQVSTKEQPEPIRVGLSASELAATSVLLHTLEREIDNLINQARSLEARS